MRHPGSLEYAAFDSDGNTLLWPDLGLKRAVKAKEPADVAPRLLATLRKTTGHDDLEFDEDGDIGLRHGSMLVWTRLVGKQSHVAIVARLLRDVEESPAMLARINEINASIGQPILYGREGSIVAVMHVSAVPYVAEHVTQAFRSFCELADGLDRKLQAEFGGSTVFDDRTTSVLTH